ncbi:MAG: SGNH/GDSL hydrolase family protein [Spirochaetaceae bacterium]|nr:SGNH/GDSL hydrolase family protein [Spirochaetaceae bacterium]
MKVTNEQLKTIYFGALQFKESKDGFLQAFQYNDEQMAYFKKASDFWYERCSASTSKTLEFSTKATEFSFDYKLAWKGSEDSIELEIDGLIDKIFYIKDLKEEGNLSFKLPEGEKKVVVYLPADATIWLKNFQIDADFVPAVKKPKVLWLGDSITQGFGPLRSSLTYVSVANKLLGYDIINQGIGGYVYDKNSLMDMGYKPEKLIVSLGTNQYGEETMDAVEEYYKRLFEIYGPLKTLCITPLWRDDPGTNHEKLEQYCEGIKAVCRKYKNIIIVDGFKLVPHLSEYFLDNLHPNALGAQIYGRNLVEKIREIGF